MVIKFSWRSETMNEMITKTTKLVITVQKIVKYFYEVHKRHQTFDMIIFYFGCTIQLRQDIQFFPPIRNDSHN